MLSSVTSSFMAGHRIAKTGGISPSDIALYYNYNDPTCWTSGSAINDLTTYNNDGQINGGASLLAKNFNFPTLSSNVAAFSSTMTAGTTLRVNYSNLFPSSTTGAVTQDGTTTIIFWLYQHIITGATEFIFSRGVFPPNTFYPGEYLQLTAAGAIQAITVSTSAATSSAYSIPLSQWKMIAYSPCCGGITKKPSSLYIDGVLVESFYQSSLQPNVSPVGYMGWGGTGTYQQLHQVYNRRLTDAEVASVYQTQKALFNL